MISTREMDERYGPILAHQVCCPLCLSDLLHHQTDDSTGSLECAVCLAVFPVLGGLPIFLLEDENWAKKTDEIVGEVLYNVEKIPLEVHTERNAFVDANTASLLAASGIDLSEDDILIVGCSMAELEFFAPRVRQAVCLDIGPRLATDCRTATRERGIRAAWVCGDGECLPFEDESFDAVVVRQSLHHMLRYFAAICEFFRVCRRGGHVLIVDEPFSPPTAADAELLAGADAEILYDSVRIGDVRAALGVSGRGAADGIPAIDVTSADRTKTYITPDPGDPESLLADKYHSFSLVSCLAAIRPHASSYALYWPRELAWSDSTGEHVRFCRGPNPHFEKPLPERLIAPGNVSAIATKTARTRLRRSRAGLRPIPLSVAQRLTGLA